jgi:GTPase SAR1 family protein
MRKARDNPYAVEHLHSLRYRFDNDDWDSLLNRLRCLRGRAAIVGPHGSGKTTLLNELALRLSDRGLRVHRLFLNAEHREFPSSFVREVAPSLSVDDVVLLDGCEQLPLALWLRFRWATRRAGGLIVTAHRPGRLPTLLECRTTGALLSALVSQLVSPPPPDATLHRLFERHQGNLREVFRELYDQAAVGTPPVR